MNRADVLKNLRNAGTFYLTTVDEEHKPKARPYGFLMDYNGKLCFTTNENKPTYKQLMGTPYVELVAMTSQFGWLRVSGRAVKVTTEDACSRALSEMPMLVQNYAVYGGKFDVFALEEAVADYYTFNEKGEIIKQSEHLD